MYLESYNTKAANLCLQHRMTNIIYTEEWKDQEGGCYKNITSNYANFYQGLTKCIKTLFILKFVNFPFHFL